MKEKFEKWYKSKTFQYFAKMSLKIPVLKKKCKIFKIQHKADFENFWQENEKLERLFNYPEGNSLKYRHLLILKITLFAINLVENEERKLLKSLFSPFCWPAFDAKVGQKVGHVIKNIFLSKSWIFRNFRNYFWQQNQKLMFFIQILTMFFWPITL